jgi:hypothetical protein
VGIVLTSRHISDSLIETNTGVVYRVHPLDDLDKAKANRERSSRHFNQDFTQPVHPLVEFILLDEIAEAEQRANVLAEQGVLAEAEARDVRDALALLFSEAVKESDCAVDPILCLK